MSIFVKTAFTNKKKRKQDIVDASTKQFNQTPLILFDLIAAIDTRYRRNVYELIKRLQGPLYENNNQSLVFVNGQ